MLNKIQCLVEECIYNDKQECTAKKINVVSCTPGNKVDCAEGTACQTFKM